VDLEYKKLQWGRDFPVAEINNPPVIVLIFHRLQWTEGDGLIRATNRTTDQTLTFSVGNSNCQCTYSETMSNMDSNGNLNTQSNANGLNFEFTTTTPVVQKTNPKKEPK
jgi:hypothetical protein